MQEGKEAALVEEEVWRGLPAQLRQEPAQSR